LLTGPPMTHHAKILSLVWLFSACGVEDDAALESVGPAEEALTAGPIHIGDRVITGYDPGAIYQPTAPQTTYTVHEAGHALVEGATVYARTICDDTICEHCGPSYTDLSCRTGATGTCTIKSNCSGYTTFDIVVTNVSLDNATYDASANHTCEDGRVNGTEAGVDCGPGCALACPVCGNGIRERGEGCDGADFGTLDCGDWGYNAGSLVCSADCRADATGCYNDPMQYHHIGDLDARRLSATDISITVALHNGYHELSSGVSVCGSVGTGLATSRIAAWSTACCTSDASGTCTISGRYCSKDKKQLPCSFIVNTYSSSVNHDPDGDSDGTRITVP
jgi:hypothetical protein